MNINFELYKIFYIVATNKSISKGAEVLLISQPAVTQAIKNLENQLDTTLFIRTKKGIILTPEGNELYQYIKDGMTYFINGTNKLQQLKELQTGTLTIGATTSITENFLLPYIKKYTEIYPNIDIKIKNDLSTNLLKELRNGNIDIVISAQPINENNDMLFKVLKTIHYIFISKEKINKKDLSKNKIIIQSHPSISRQIFDEYVKQNNITIKTTLEVVSHHLLIEFTKNNQGIGFAVKEYLKDNTLYEIPINNLPTREIGYIINKNYTPTQATKKFIEILKK